MTTSNPIPTQPETLDELCPWCRRRPQRYMVPANNPHDPCGGIVPRVRCITYQCPLNCFDMTPEDWNRRAAVTAPRGDAQKFAEEVVGTIFDNTGASHETLKATMIERIADAFAAATSSPAPAESVTDELVDEVQRRMDQVVEAAVEWHQAGREGREWFEAAERLSAAINLLLELRDAPDECFCGTELEAGLCPNGHDPVSPPRITPAPAPSPETPTGKQPTVLDEARRLLTECCYTINALADQQAMPDDSYKRTLDGVGRFMESITAPAERTRVEGEQSYSEGFDDAARVARVLSNVATSGSARRAAEAVIDELDRRALLVDSRGDRPIYNAGKARLVEIVRDRIQRTLAAAPADNDAESLELLRTSAVLCISGDGQPRVSLLFKELKDAQAVHGWLVRLVHGTSTTPTKGDR